jgi:hypothetical protein
LLANGVHSILTPKKLAYSEGRRHGNFMDLSFIVFSCSFALGFLIEVEELSAGPRGKSNYAKVFGIGLMSWRLRLHNRARASTKCDMETTNLAPFGQQH